MPVPFIAVRLAYAKSRNFSASPQKRPVGTFPRSIIDINIFVWISVYILPDKLQHFFAPVPSFFLFS